MADLFDSAWLKWGWAVLESKTLYDDWVAFAEDEDAQRLNTTATYYNAKRHGVILAVTSLAPFPPHIPLRFSTVTHGFRSCLDNLAWALVRRGATPPETLTPREQRGIFFPICEKRDGDKGFNTLLKGTNRRPPVLPGVARRDIAIVRKAQPYVRGKRNLPYHTLNTLSALNNADKHRSIQPVPSLPEYMAYTIVARGDCEFTDPPLRARRRILEIGTEVARFPVRRTGPNPYLQVEYELATFPAINERISLENWLDETMLSIAGLLLEFATPPKDDFAKLGLPQMKRAT